MKKIKDYVFLHILILLFSFSSVCSKLASGYDFLSFKFCLFYGLAILILGVYAILWQQVLKKFTLTTAFLNKAVTVVWGIVLGFLILGEGITLNMIIGAIIVLIGVGIVVQDYE